MSQTLPPIKTPWWMKLIGKFVTPVIAKSHPSRDPSKK